MQLKKILKEKIEEIKPNEREVKQLKKDVKVFIERLNQELAKTKHGGDVFVGGSFAKNTLIKDGKYDVDVFVRFPWEYDDISPLLEKVLQKLAKKLGLKMEKLHGSRDYFRIYFSDNAYFEIIPVTKIRKPSEERNVTDLSYFHVSYVKKKIKGLENQVLLAKSFCQAQKVYGAETYVRGFSGYSLELMVLHYGSFLKMLRELVKAEKGTRIILDPGKHYRRKDDVLFELNEAKLQSPVILVDPTNKDRNALASLSRETFEKFQEAARKFLKSPDKVYFSEDDIDLDKLKDLAEKKKAEFIHVNIRTDRQAGDIAGTKLKKFHYYVESEIKKYFELLKHEFVYSGKQEADFYMIVKSKKEIIQLGPPMYTKRLRKHIQAFKEAHRGRTFVKDNMIYARIPVDFSGKEFIEKINRDKDKLNEMGITEMKVG
ncbi:hypothetical protein CO038_03490 [Candidatus Pacearchaeota archaeon CG_4_9_14_0_2_um_filter_39_13]|nr:hypothetical protein [Candidatus Pacearchaeota archaeon]OIO43599.1 MAG: hypothetical protein AUJ64_01975 [Candidatus Pacearchaeota archaeon CG1_02_39_14]PJC44481.1 MAG: hypothetical protein CO038_03490 [Candidatus Pacearchaeota archaeon CG_4_9_14_0_2_um_filter_39_13]